MVVLHVKSATSASSSPPGGEGEEEMEFLHECAATAAVADVADALASTAALQARVLSLCRRLRDTGGCADARDLERALSEAEAYASKVQVQHNRFLSPRSLREHIKNIEKIGANALQESSGETGLQQPTSDYKHEGVKLCWAGKELDMDRRLSDYIGVNEKTKIVIRLSQAFNRP